jgi:iron(III) transport system ATP-binding protein
MSDGLRILAVSKTFGAVRAVDSVTLDAPPGSRLAIVGPSGSGKTTLLRLIAGFEAPDSGMIQLGETCLAKAGYAMPAHQRDIGIVSQDGALFPHMSIAQNIGFGLPKATRDRDHDIAQLVDMVGLDQRLLGRRPDEISGGQQQRVALARALARRPRIMLLDEPFSALDTGLRASTRRAVSGLLGERAITTVMVTHDQGEALSFADQVAVMHEGRVLQAGDPRDLYFRPATPFVAEFLGDAIILDAVCDSGVATCRLGRIPVASAPSNGPTTILLRPEQIVLAPARAGDDFACTVEAVEFGGAFSQVTLRPVASADQTAVTLRRTAMDELRIGELVSIAVIGAAHAFPA